MTPPDPGVATWQATSAGAGAAAWRRSKMAGFPYVFLEKKGVFHTFPEKKR